MIAGRPRRPRSRRARRRRRRRASRSPVKSSGPTTSCWPPAPARRRSRHRGSGCATRASRVSHATSSVQPPWRLLPRPACTSATVTCSASRSRGRPGARALGERACGRRVADLRRDVGAHLIGEARPVARLRVPALDPRPHPVAARRSWRRPSCRRPRADPQRRRRPLRVRPGRIRRRVVRRLSARRAVPGASLLPPTPRARSAPQYRIRAHDAGAGGQRQRRAAGVEVRRRRDRR